MMNGIWKNLCLQFVHEFCGFEKMDEESKEVFSNLVTLSEKLGVDLQEDNVTELLGVQHKGLTNEDLMEMEAWRKSEILKMPLLGYIITQFSFVFPPFSPSFFHLMKSYLPSVVGKTETDLLFYLFLF